MAKDDDGPESPLDYVLERLILLVGHYTPRPIQSGIYYSLFAVSPELPTTLWRTFEFPGTKVALARIFLATLVICFGFSVLLSAVSGTLLPDQDSATIQFLEDKWNVFLYLFVCPAYVSLCFHIMGLAVRHWGRRAAIKDTPREKKRRRSRLFFATLLVTACSIMFVTNFLFDAVHSQSIYHGIVVKYWYLQAAGARPVLNQAGFFYVILNFILISITFLAVFVYVALLLDALSIVANLELGKCAHASEIVTELNPYLSAMLVAKWVAAVYVVNIFVWTFSPGSSATSENLAFSVGGLVLVGWLGTMLPRIHLERRLRLYRRQCEDAGAPAEALRLLPVRSMRWGQLVDGLLGVSFVFAYLRVDPILDPFRLFFG